MGLMAHTDTDLITREQLAALPAPVSLGPRHNPPAFHDIVEALDLSLKHKGYAIASEQISVGGIKRIREGDQITQTVEHCKMFGVMNLEPLPAGPNDEVSLPGQETGQSLGFRASVSQSLALQIVAGANVFVCDNLMITGDCILIKRKQTTNLHILPTIDEAVDRWLGRTADLTEGMSRMQDNDLTDTEARAKLFTIFEDGALTPRLLQPVAKTYFAPEEAWTDVTPRTDWGLYNSITRNLREQPLHLKMEQTQRVAPFFGV